MLGGCAGLLAELECGVKFRAVGGDLRAVVAYLVGFVLAGGFLVELPEGEGGFYVCAAAAGVQCWWEAESVG